MCAVSSSFCEGFGSVEVFGGGDLRWGLLAHPPSSFPWKHIWCRQVFSPLETAVLYYLGFNGDGSVMVLIVLIVSSWLSFSGTGALAHVYLNCGKSQGEL
ncbi:hypothetical protein Bca4012_063714 [Brassica carinata]